MSFTTPSLENVICIDFEASSLGRRSFPIEVAIADVTAGTVRAWLIRPAPLWLAAGTWSEDSEAMHGLSLAKITEEGLPAGTVAQELDHALAGKTVLSDNAGYDQAWLETLCTAGQRIPSCAIADFARFAAALAEAQGRRADIALMKAETEAQSLFPQRHRAGPDARRNAEILRQIAGGRRPAAGEAGM